MVVKKGAAGGAKKRISNVELEQGKCFSALKFDSERVQIFPESFVDNSYRINGTEVQFLNANGCVIGAIDPGHGVILHTIKTESHFYVVYLQKIIKVWLRDLQEMEVILSIVSRITLVNHSSTMNSLFILDIEDTLRIIDIRDDAHQDKGKTMTTIQGIVNFCVHPSGPWMCACSAEDASILIYFLTALNKVKGVNKVCTVEGNWNVFVQQMTWREEDGVYYKLSDQNIYRIPFDNDQVIQSFENIKTARPGRPRLDKNNYSLSTELTPKRQEVRKKLVRQVKSAEIDNIIISDTTGRPKRAAARKVSYKEVQLEEIEDKEDQPFSPEEEEEKFVESE